MQQLWGGKRLDKKTEQSKPLRVAVLLETDVHIQVTFFGLWAIGSANTIPPRKIETEITVGFAHDRRMVDAMHIGGNQEKAQQAVKSGRKPDIAVAEHGTCIQNHLEGQHRGAGSAQKEHRRHFNQHRNGNFQRMEAIAAGDIQIEVRVVHSVQAP